MAIEDVAAKYAPLVVLHDQDKLRPCSADWFLERSSLRWATGLGLDGDEVPEASGDVDPGRLGAASSKPYGFDGHLASALTRPLDDNATRGGKPLALSQATVEEAQWFVWMLRLSVWCLRQ